MRRFTPEVKVARYARTGLMVLSEHFQQRAIKATYSSFRSRLPLTSPSGAQYVESELEAELLEQLAFAPDVYDLLTQPIIEYEHDGKLRRYTPDIVIQLYSGHGGAPCRYIVEVKRQADLLANRASYEIRFAAGRRAAKEAGGAFRVMDECRIRTPYLANARLLQRHRRVDPEFEAYDLLRDAIGAGTLPISSALDVLRDRGIDEPDARIGIEQAIAWRLLACDLTRPFDDAMIISAPELGSAAGCNDDPIIRTLREAASE